MSKAWASSRDPLAVGVVLTNLVALVVFSVLALRQDFGSEVVPSLRGERTDYVVVVTGEGSVDGLVAESLGDAVLWLPRARGRTSLISQVQALQPTSVVVLGGADVVSSDAVAILAESITAPVQRLAGPDRFATAARAALRTFTAPVERVLVVTAEASLAEARAAGLDPGDQPVLLVTRDGVPADTRRALQRLRPERVTVVGRSSDVSDAVLEQLQAYTATRVERVPAA